VDERPTATCAKARLSPRATVATPVSRAGFGGGGFDLTRAALTSKHFPEHFKQTRRLRFLDGQSISPDVPIHIVWGEQDHIARTRRSRRTDQLPGHATVETWPHCGHMLTWDNPKAVIDASLALPAPAVSDAQVSPSK
jgi:pimeloyl-ACP methyl ester carboxylesterase